MTSDNAKHIHGLIIANRWTEAANAIMVMMGEPSNITSKQRAITICRGLFKHLLESENYLLAATLQWGGDLFNAEPESVVRVFEAWRTGNQILLMGASSMGKTFSSGAWLALDWMRDPLYTTVKLAAVNEGHLNDNLFAHVKRLVTNCAIPCEHDIHFKDADLWFGVRGAGYEFGFSGLAFKQSQETSGQFKGYKPLPVRKFLHPKFGVLSRLRVLGDEGQNWPGGPFKDFNSLLASKEGPEVIKVAVAFNPESTDRLVVQMAEPEQGWNADELDSLYDYTSKAGWTVCRLDAARSENVIQKKKVFTGLQSYEGFLSYLKAGGDNSANYWCFARGFPPIKGSINTIIPPAWPQDARGEATFIQTPVTVAAVDLAFMGKDSAQMAVGRWGLASGWRNSIGKFESFKDRLNIAVEKPRHVLQIDQILPLSKHDDTVKMAEEIMGRCKMLKVIPENCAIDKTGYGFGTWSHLIKVWGPVYGISWNEKATEGKILSEDQEPASKQCSGLMSEMWWAFRRWIDPSCRAILINPIVPPQPIHTQLTSRRYETTGKGITVEPKDRYKSRNAGQSPDESDALVMLVHIVRQTSDVIPGLTEAPARSANEQDFMFESVRNMVSIDKDDSMSIEGTEQDHIETTHA